MRHHPQAHPVCTSCLHPSKICISRHVASPYVKTTCRVATPNFQCLVQAWTWAQCLERRDPHSCRRWPSWPSSRRDCYIWKKWSYSCRISLKIRQNSLLQNLSLNLVALTCWLPVRPCSSASAREPSRTRRWHYRPSRSPDSAACWRPDARSLRRWQGGRRRSPRRRSRCPWRGVRSSSSRRYCGSSRAYRRAARPRRRRRRCSARHLSAPGGPRWARPRTAACGYSSARERLVPGTKWEPWDCGGSWIVRVVSSKNRWGSLLMFGGVVLWGCIRTYLHWQQKRYMRSGCFSFYIT